MEKKNKKPIRFLGWKLKEMIQLGTVLGAFFWGMMHLEDKFDKIDDRFVGVEVRLDKVEARLDKVEFRLDNIEHRLDKIEIDLNKTSTLLDAYLTWRFIYINDPLRKNLVPVYDPRTRTLDFVNKK